MTQPTVESLAAAEEAGPRLRRLAVALLEDGCPAAAPVRSELVPGRIEILGKHTDYAGGRSLLAATEQGLAVVSAPRDAPRLRLLDAGRGESAELALDPELELPADHWSVYGAVVARRLARDFPGPWRGADLAFDSDLPADAGLSSSSALVVAFYRVLAAANRLHERPEVHRVLAHRADLAAYLGAVESGRGFGPLDGGRGVGTQGGAQDHTAILCSEAGRAIQVRFLPSRRERAVPLPRGWRFAVAVSGVRASKTGAAAAPYNRAARLAAAVGELWRAGTGRSEPHLGAIAARGDGADRELRRLLASARHPEFTPDQLTARWEQFREESERLVPAAGDALAGGDLRAFGRLTARSQRLAETRLGNQTPETAWLAAEAHSAGAAAASAFGAGFGGAVWSLVRRDEADALLSAWAAGYRRRFPEHASRCRFLLTRAAPPARRLAPRAVTHPAASR